MKIKIYQIRTEADHENLKFMHLEFALKKGNGRINENIYEIVYKGDVQAENLEEIFYIFNNEYPAEYKGHSLSVSDIVEADGIGTFYCDRFGFQKIMFDGSKCSWRKE